jgi:hypothetical protein
MSNFSKEQRVAFEQVVESFDDALVLSKLVKTKRFDAVELERSSNVVWRPVPYIATSYSGTDQTANFQNYTQMAVPSVVNQNRSVPFQMSDTELRDAIQEGRLKEAAGQKLASDINLFLLQLVSNQGTQFVKRASAASGFDDVAAMAKIFNEQGIPMQGRKAVFAPGDWNGMMSNLQQASRSFGDNISDDALKNAYINQISSFGVFMLDYAQTKTAAAGGGGLTASTTYTAGGSGNYWLPLNLQGSAGLSSNVDNRYQTITVSSTTNVVAGDAFTIANVFACHRITKASTGALKTFRVISVPSSTTMVISPPIINSAGLSQAEQAYGNVVVTSQSGTAAIVFLNTVTATQNPFWVEGAVELLAGTFNPPSDAGVNIMRASTSQGIEVVMMKGYDINTRQVKTRFDVFYGGVVLQPEMAGIAMFSQT